MNKCKPIFIIKVMMLSLPILWFGLSIEAKAQHATVGQIYGCPVKVPKDSAPWWIFSQNYGSVQLRVSNYHYDAINFGAIANYKTACSAPHFNIHVIFDSLSAAQQ